MKSDSGVVEVRRWCREDRQTAGISGSLVKGPVFEPWGIRRTEGTKRREHVGSAHGDGEIEVTLQGIDIRMERFRMSNVRRSHGCVPWMCSLNGDI